MTLLWRKVKSTNTFGIYQTEIKPTKLHINFLLGLCTLSDILSSSQGEPHSVPPAAADKADGLAPPPDGAEFTDEGEAEIMKNNLAEDENFEGLDLHDEAAQAQGKNKIVTHLTL